MKLRQAKQMLAKASRSVRELNRRLAIEIPYPHEHSIIRALPNSQPERDQAKPLGGAVPGETKSLPRPVISFVGYRVQPLDPDNFSGSVKDLLDGLRHSGLISGDGWWQIILQTSQEKVSHRNEERTEIEISLP